MEVRKISDALKPLGGVLKVEVSVPDKTFTVEFDLNRVNQNVIKEKVEGVGLKVIDEKTKCTDGHCTHSRHLTAIISSPTTLHVYDSTGAAFVYSLPPSVSSPPPMSKICFSSHNMDSDLMTPCFDEDGRHGEPEETCMCGDDEVRSCESRSERAGGAKRRCLWASETPHSRQQSYHHPPHF